MNIETMTAIIIVFALVLQWKIIRLRRKIRALHAEKETRIALASIARATIEFKRQVRGHPSAEALAAHRQRMSETNTKFAADEVDIGE